jgi:hypothetical protein
MLFSYYIVIKKSSEMYELGGVLGVHYIKLSRRLVCENVYYNWFMCKNVYYMKFICLHSTRLDWIGYSFPEWLVQNISVCMTHSEWKWNPELHCIPIIMQFLQIHLLQRGQDFYKYYVIHPWVLSSWACVSFVLVFLLHSVRTLYSVLYILFLLIVASCSV